ncbi:putative Ig domain-containing protein [Geomonas oryzisoli]|uniref:Ig domain-containing protein n=1 Tax=Geomonas oryzisoli TaxID=2847992 RepID=A0ABX8J8X2_9BACT|nr:putative Ig domain-containing protein [Geomonas oryzisoli]QWV93144.1 putative Ig domain-containing protein [Geomonas oryzisoli]
MKQCLTRKPYRAPVIQLLAVCALLLNLLTGTVLAAQGDIITIAGGGVGDGGLAVSAVVGANKIVADNAGNVYIADQDHHRVRKVAPSGVITTVAGTGTPGNSGDDGPATQARLNYPMGVALDGNGNLFIADTNNNLIRKVDPSGIITTVAGTGMASFSGDGPALASALNTPVDIVVDPSGALIVADRSNYRVRKVAGGMMTTIAGVGWWGSTGDGGPATAASLTFPSGIAVDQAGNVFIADESNHKIRMVGTNGIITTVMGTGEPGFNGDGLNPAMTQLQYPRGVAFDQQGRLLIVDSNNNRIRRIDTVGTVSTVAGNGDWGFSGDGGPATAAALLQPGGVACDGSGNLIIADTGNYRIRSVDFLGNISTFAGNGTNSWTGDGGPAANAAFYWVGSVVADQAGNRYIADSGNHRIRRIDGNGMVWTVAGTGVAGYGQDGIPAGATTLSNPIGLALDASGNLYIADSGNNRIRKIDSAGIITTVAGNGAAASNGDGLPANLASVNQPVGVALDALGNLYVAEFSGNRVRKIDTAGIITTVAGNGFPDYNGDNISAAAAAIGQPGSVSIDADGNLYIADSYNARIRKVDPSGIISTVAGTGEKGYSGDGLPAVAAGLENPLGVRAFNGSLYISGGNRVRKVDSQGEISTLAGNGAPGFSGDYGPATAAALNFPTAVWIDPDGTVLISDSGNGRIRLVYPGAPDTAVLIDSGANSTSSYNVTLTLTCMGVTGVCGGVQLSNDAATWTSTIPFQATMPWTLLPGEGAKTVYVRFVDDFSTWSGVYSDSIYLVGGNPGVTIQEPVAGGVYGNDPLLVYSLSGPVGSVTVYVDGTVMPKVSGDHLGPLAVGPHQVRVQVRDPYGVSMAFAESSFTVDGTVAFADDFEGGTLKWESVNGLWHLATPGSLYPNSHSGGNSMWYGQEPTGNYDVGANSGWIVSTPFTVPASGTLRFWSWEQVESNGDMYDTRKVYVSAEGGAWVQVYQSLDDSSAWHQVGVDLAQFAGKSARLIFEFKSVDGASNDFRGWYLDDITVSGAAAPPVAAGYEGFESGLLQSPPWIPVGGQPWRVVSDSSHTGAYSARSGAIVDGQTSVLETSVDCAAGDMSFWFAVESESNFDFLTVQVDGVERGRWSGSYGWTQASIPVSAGPHTFRWTYLKDTSVSVGRDAAWIDDIVFPTAGAVPVVTMTSPVQGAVYKESPLLSFNTTASAATIYLDGIVTPLQNGMPLPSLADGSHTVRVESSSAAGMAAAEVSFFIDATAPVVTITAPLPGSVVGNTPVLAYSANEGGTVTVWIDGIQTEAPSGMSLKYLPDGSHTVHVQEVDAAGNIGFAESSFIVRGGSVATSFIDDMESGLGKWESASGLWNLASLGSSSNGNSHSGYTSWWYGQESTGNYDVGLTSGALVSRAFTVGASATLKFWSWEQTEANTNYDTRKVFLSTDGGATWMLLVQLTDATSSWHEVVTNLEQYAGMQVKLKFEFNSVDGVANAYRGWYLDDISVTGPGAPGPAPTGETFESGDLSALPWVSSGNAPWTVTTGNQHGGQFAAKAGTIFDGQSSSLETTVDSPGGTMSFWFAVSSEYYWDVLHFYVDDVEQGNWSGDVGWTQFQVAVAPGIHTFRWRYTKDGSVSVGADTAWIDDIVFPAKAVPTVTLTSPVPGGSYKEEPVLSYSVSEGSEVVKLDGIEIGTRSGYILPPLGDGPHTVRVEASNTAGTGYAEATFVVDRVAPVVTITSPASGTTDNSQPLLAYSASEGAPVVKLDGVVVSVPSGSALPQLADGIHTVRVEATDGAGNVGFAEVSFTVDTVHLVLSVDPLPSLMNSNSFVLTGTRDSRANYFSVISSNGGSFGMLTNPTDSTWRLPITGVREGSTTFDIREEDGAGHVATTSLTVVVDTVAPVVTIASPVAGVTGKSTPILNYTVSEGVPVVRLDGVEVARASGDTLGPLSEGAHTVRVEASDAAGNVGFAQVSFTVDSIAPVVTIASPAAGLGNNRTPVLTYSVSEGDAVVFVDGVVAAKASGDTLGPFADGPHTVRVEATDAAGNVGFAQANFSVDATAPVVTIASPAAGLGNNRTPILTYSISEGAAVVWVDGVVVAKTSGDTLGPLADGPHTVKVVVTDTAANSSVAEVSFTVDATAPTVTITSPASGTTPDGTPLLLYTVGDGSIVVKVDGVVVNKTSGSSLEPLPNGNHTVTVEATDAAGNTGRSSVTFTVAYTALAVDTVALPFGTSGTAYNRSLSASGGVPGYTWSIASGNLPAGLTLNGSTGVIAGVPGTAGSYAFTVRVADSDGASVTGSFTITVYQPVQIGTTSLAGGYAGASYSQSLSASGGTGSYAWSVVSGSLPAGLSLNQATGQIAGTPSVAGSSNFTVECRDGNQTAAMAASTIVIEAARPDLVVTVVSGPTSGTRGKKVMLTATVKNQGQAVAGASTLSFYLSSDGAISSADTKVADVSVVSLAVGGSQTVSFNATVPATLSVGSYVIGAIADRGGVVAETDENNNTQVGGSIDIR